MAHFRIRNESIALSGIYVCPYSYVNSSTKTAEHWTSTSNTTSSINSFNQYEFSSTFLHEKD